MQVDIKNTSIFQTTIEQIVLLKDRVTQKINFMNNELQKKKSEVNNELIISENFLNVAKAYEMQKQAIEAEKSIQLAQALQQEAAASGTGRRPLRHLRRQKLASEHPPAGSRLHGRGRKPRHPRAPPAQGPAPGRLQRDAGGRTGQQDRRLIVPASIRAREDQARQDQGAAIRPRLSHVKAAPEPRPPQQRSIPDIHRLRSGDRRP